MKHAATMGGVGARTNRAARAWQLRGDLGAAIVAGTGRRCLRQLSGHTHRAARQLCEGSRRGHCRRPLSAALGGGALGNLAAVLTGRRGRQRYAGYLL